MSVCSAMSRFSTMSHCVPLCLIICPQVSGPHHVLCPTMSYCVPSCKSMFRYVLLYPTMSHCVSPCLSVVRHVSMCSVISLCFIMSQCVPSSRSCVSLCVCSCRIVSHYVLVCSTMSQCVSSCLSNFAISLCVPQILSLFFTSRFVSSFLSVFHNVSALTFSHSLLISRGKVIPLQARCGTEVQLYSFMTAALEGCEWSAARPGRTLPLRKTWYPFYRRLGGPQGWSGRAENLLSTGIRSRTVQPVAQSLY